MILNFKHFLKSYKSCSRCFSQLIHSNILCPLNRRSLLEIKGSDVSQFLQGLITNDVRHLEDGASSMFTMFLNTRGRVLYDSLIYRTEDANVYLLESDKDVSTELQNHLKMFKLRKKIEIKPIHDLLLWVLFTTSKTVENDTSKIDSIDINNTKISNLKVYKDPRIAQLGVRILSPASFSSENVISGLNMQITAQSDDFLYTYHRYKLGVGEGIADLPPNLCFPLEVNCDYLHGVSFHKGCYIGQELTARVHHTGVVRKRLMPIIFGDRVSEKLEYDIQISTKEKENIGKLKGVIKDAGLGLVRIAEALETKELLISNLKVSAVKPNWWPLEASKEKAGAATK